ncbi:MAG: tyrosine--tRNA ligase [Methanosphaera sp.]|uniref:tyrosine--tRNA ligase n=1 Tax=Methanosphaera sp. TaxID=2666342 RepID=UPI0025DC33D2|nr:tyrosine--tRNA ligase [Methanosphaera sp.]MCI5867786.1 tyrosine--tRNA ligase [Methanosphaera sp.]MDD6535255.1 tyrosine--tRNA ligase [Methanosphaera sp.]MDY3956416.1 tyrosine--tRNA ligase [Methanosphaera sp.]
MNIDEAIAKITKDTTEVIEVEELKEILKKDEKVAYVGFEPSGKVHLGHALTVKRMIALRDAGFKIKIFVANLHGFLNGKGTLKELNEIADYNIKCFKALGLDENTEYILGSDRITFEYMSDVFKAAQFTTISRAQRSMAQVSRDSENHNVAEALYPIMQAMDIHDLGVDVAVGGMEQRKIHMLAREILPKMGYDAPVVIHIPLIHGTDGSDKMSSSKGNFIGVDDSEKEIKTKINKSFCPIGEVEGNPVMELAHYYIFDENEKIHIERPEKFGGNLDLTEDELYDIYSKEELHPMDLKNTVAKYLVEKLAPVRKYMEEN